jgi:hypothetical protein
MPPTAHPLSLPDSRSQVLSRTTNFAARNFSSEMLFTSAMPTHIKKPGRCAHYLLKKTSQYFRFLPVCCVIAQRAARSAQLVAGEEWGLKHRPEGEGGGGPEARARFHTSLGIITGARGAPPPPPPPRAPLLSAI